MNFIYENQGTATYLTYEVQPEETIDTMSLGMLTHNSIPGLARTIYSQMDNSRYVRYNVSAKVSVKQFFSGPINKKRFLGICTGIVSAMISTEDYMLDPGSILFDNDYIFVDVTTCETVLVCLPILELSRQNVDLGLYFKNMMFSTQFDQTENCDYVAKIMNYLNSAPVFSASDFKILLNTLKDSAIPSSASIAPQSKTLETGVVAPIKQVNPVPASVAPVAPIRVQKPPVINPNSNTAPQKVAVAKPAPVCTPPQQPISGGMKTPSASGMAIPGGNDGMKIPAGTPVAAAPVAASSGESDKKMSLMYLMQHYNKENAEIYKNQKASKSAGASPVAPAKAAKPSKKGGAQPVPATFNMPGAAVGMPIPGQAVAPIGSMSTPAAVKKPPVVSAPTPVGMPTSHSPVMPTPAISAPKPTVQQPMNFGETTVLSGGATFGETTVLSATSVQKAASPHLIRTKNNERININKPVFRIGKEKSYVDYFIGDNSTISRSHANIIVRDSDCFITDTNSTNHTYVNGDMIQSGTEFKLSHGDKVRLANEEFEFKLY